MAQQTKEEIVSAWRALSSGMNDKVGWRSINISGEGDNRILAARRFPGNGEALLIRFETVTLPQTALLPQGSGFKVERATLNDSEKWLALVRQPQGNLDLFSLMVSDIVATLSTNESADDAHYFQLFLGRIRAWQDFMKKGGGGLSPEAELGLVGELTCLNELLDLCLSRHSIIDGWVGPMDGLQDFELGYGAIEVKSTLSNDGFPATIMSLEQLDNAIRQPLFICGCSFSIANGGFTLPRRISFLRNKLASDTAALTLLNNALLHAGYLDVHEEKYSRNFQTCRICFILVDDDFPRLIAGNVPIGIRRVRYEIDLNSVISKQISIANVVKMIGII